MGELVNLDVESTCEVGIVEEETEVTTQTSATWVHEDLAQVRIKVLRGHQDSVVSCQFCDNDTKLLTASHDKSVILWDMEKGINLEIYEGHSMNISKARANQACTNFVSAGWDKKVHYWNMETGRILWTASHDTIITTCNISHDGKYVIAGSDLDGTLKLWDAHNGQLIHTNAGLHSSTITSCTFAPKDDRIVTTSMDMNTKFWDMKTRQTTITLKGHHNIVSDAAISREERSMATVSWDKTINFYDISTGMYRSEGPSRIEKAHEGCLSSCDFTEDGTMLVTAGYDMTVALWDVENRVQKLRLQGHEDWIEDICMSKDQNWILSASKDKTVRLWNIEESDKIPLVVEAKKAIGMKLFKCNDCGKPFSSNQLSRWDDRDYCVFCRLDRTRPSPIPSSVEASETPALEQE